MLSMSVMLTYGARVQQHDGRTTNKTYRTNAFLNIYFVPEDFDNTNNAYKWRLQWQQQDTSSERRYGISDTSERTA